MEQHCPYIARLAASLLIIAFVTSIRTAGGAEEVTLTTKDRVELAATYFASSEKEHATPVIILHDYEGSRRAHRSIAERLQDPTDDNQKSLAVLTVDLRGHGESKKQQLPNGSTRELDASKLRKGDFYDMIEYDMTAVRRFLVDKNDEKEINLNKLSIIGSGLGASVATIWAAADWSWPPLRIGKQGQDVKALVLVSPRWKNRGLLMQKAIRQPGVQRQVAMMMIYGRDETKVRSDVLRIKKQIEKFHPEPEDGSDEPNDLAGISVPNTSLQGDQLLGELGDKLVDPIAKFLNLHVVGERYEWSQRKRRLD